MFERYTEAARRLLFFARYETSQFGSTVIDTEHMLLGLVRVNKGITARVFSACGVSAEGLRHDVEAAKTNVPPTSTSVEIPFSDGTRRVLHYAEEEADRLKHSYIGTEHLLIALVRANDTTGGAILARHGMTLDDTRQRVVEQTTAPPPPD
jgi:ATP-dependent Clp protease ATP-binding subunit ClpC